MWNWITVCFTKDPTANTIEISDHPIAKINDERKVREMKFKGRVKAPGKAVSLLASWNSKTARKIVYPRTVDEPTFTPAILSTRFSVQELSTVDFRSRFSSHKYYSDLHSVSCKNFEIGRKTISRVPIDRISFSWKYLVHARRKWTIPRLFLRSGLDCCVPRRKWSGDKRVGRSQGCTATRTARIPRKTTSAQSTPELLSWERTRPSFLLSYYAEYYLRWSAFRWKPCYPDYDYVYTKLISPLGIILSWWG